MSSHGRVRLVAEVSMFIGSSSVIRRDLDVDTQAAIVLGALLESDVEALVYAIPNDRDGAAGTVIQLAQHPGLTRRLKIVSGIRRDEAEELFAAEAQNGAGANGTNGNGAAHAATGERRGHAAAATKPAAPAPRR